MKMLTREGFQEVRLWVYRNGRQIDVALWRHAFEEGDREEVLHALSLYQNEDGGFGNALEPDNWNPESTPYTTRYALDMLDEVGLDDGNHPIVRGILRFFESGVHVEGEDWLFAIPSNNHYPHAPWWTYSQETNKVESGGLSISLASLLLKYADEDSTLYRKALAIAKNALKKMGKVADYGEMGVEGLWALEKMIDSLHWEDEFDGKQITGVIERLANETMERNPDQWGVHCKKPSAFITSPDDDLYKANESIMNQELDWLVDTRHANGVWDIDWSWYDNNEKYAKEFAISENWWKANNARGIVTLLCRFGRMEDIG